MLKRIPILMYHSIEPEGSNRIRKEEKFYNVAPNKFSEHIEYLVKNGFTTISLDKLMRVEKDSDLPEKPIILTFDDGHISHYDTALPRLKRAGLKAAFFLVTNDMGAENRITWEHARAFKDSGMDIGSHGENHTIMHGFTPQDLIIELKTSKIELEDNLETKISAFSIPRGLYSSEISSAARGMGYKMLFTSITGNTTLNSDPYRIKRIVILRNYSMSDFVSIVRKDITFLVKKRVQHAAKNTIQKVIGIKAYDRLKATIFSGA